MRNFETKEIRLTPRERETLEFVALGLTNGKIAKAMGITAHTVKVNLENIYFKFDVHNRIQAVLTGIERGVIELPKI